VSAQGVIPGSSDPIAAVLPGGIGGTTPFPNGSRYAGLPLAEIEIDGEPVRYVTRRFVPGPERFALLREHVVTAGERPDTVAATQLGDPEQYWRLCDANNVLHPCELVAQVGRHLRITLPEGLPGAPDA
jgi:hypothetical protein